MGTGKTLMCLSLIVSTLHQTCKPPSNIIEISPATTENAERTYPFEANAQLRETTGFPLSETRLAIPSLLDLSANILALNDHSFRRVPDLPSSAETLLFGKTFYYHFPLVNDCMRQAKRSAISQQVKRVCLANSTLVVVPGILIQQWKDEMEKHVDQGVLRVLEVGKENLPNIDELLGYDVSLSTVAISHAEAGI